VTYRLYPGDSLSNRHNIIQALYEDRDGNLWVGTRNSLNRFNRSTNTFTPYYPKSGNSPYLSNFITCIYEDQTGNMWIGTRAGLARFDRENNSFHPYLLLDRAYSPELYSYIDTSLANNPPLAILSDVGKFQDLSTWFEIVEKTTLLIVATAESRGQDWLDFGWLENSRGEEIWQMEFAQSCRMGNWAIDRIQIASITLPAGRYRLRYKSDRRYRTDFFYPYHEWAWNRVVPPPAQSNFQGIRVFRMPRTADRLNAMLKQPPDEIKSNILPLDICEDSRSGTIFVGSYTGLLALDEGEGILRRYHPDQGNTPVLNYWNSFKKGKHGIIWITSPLGLYRFNTAERKINLYQAKPSRKSPPGRYTPDPLNNIITLIEDHTGIVWAASAGGMLRFDPKSEQFTRCDWNDRDPNRLSSSEIRTFYEDRSGILWVSTVFDGLNYWDRKKWLFRGYRHDEDNAHSLGNDQVLAVYEDQDETVWIGTDNGLDRLDRHTREFKHYLHNPADPASLSANRVTAIGEDSSQSNKLWIGTWGGGLNEFDTHSGVFHHYRHTPGDTNSLSGDLIENVFTDPQGVLWVSTWGGGLNRFSAASGKFHHIDYERVMVFYNDKTTGISQNSLLWIGSTDKGISVLDRLSGKILRDYSNIEGSEYSGVTALYADKAGNFWAGTYSSGLHLFDRHTGNSINYTDNEGLANNTVRHIMEDSRGKLWISTQHGLSKFDPISKKFKNYYQEDGLITDQFYRHSGWKTHSGQMYFGGNNGLLVFHPDSVQNDPIPPQVQLTRLSLFNRPTESLLYSGQISELKRIVLAYHQNDLHFQFVGLHFSDPKRIRYAYMLENFDESWADAGDRREAVYTNLDPGEYVFHVKAANPDGVWNQEGASLSILITPPWWKTWWAYLLYAGLMAGLAYGVFYFLRKRWELHNRLTLEQQEAQRLKELDHFKSRLYTNLTHEFRTPLTVILGMTGQMAEATQQAREQAARLIERNGQQLLALINQLLDLSKLEDQSFQLNLQQGDIVAYLRYVTESFHTFVNGKNLSLQFHSTIQELVMDFDAEQIQQVMTNLISNAAKFTPSGGDITVQLDRETDAARKRQAAEAPLRIQVKDTGIGIAEAHQPHIFDRFYQVANDTTRTG
ncbi:MAG: hypothetical protein KDE62_17325, partial [Calditrichaeota bacterium]|nr:hypothetical protein [Calditrichota bacterium]